MMAVCAFGTTSGQQLGLKRLRSDNEDSETESAEEDNSCAR